jgi:hypothetical protein
MTAKPVLETTEEEEDGGDGSSVTGGSRGVSESDENDEEDRRTIRGVDAGEEEGEGKVTNGHAVETEKIGEARVPTVVPLVAAH